MTHWQTVTALHLMLQVEKEKNRKLTALLEQAGKEVREREVR